MNFEIVPATAVSLDEQAQLANDAFAGYVGGWTEMDTPAVARFLMLQGTDLFYSRLVRMDGELAGFGYINRTASILRLSGMALIPSARGTGAAAFLLNHLFEEAKANGDATMMLEVIEQNPRAIALYRRHEFRELTRLTGWCIKPDSRRQEESAASVRPLPVIEALDSPSVWDYPEVTWAISRHAIAKVAKTRAFTTGDVHVIISDPETSPIRVQGLFSESVDWSRVRAAVAGVMALFPEAEFFAPAVWPEEFGDKVFGPLGFVLEPISQFLMRRDF